jgi:hypothetical protein
VISTFAGKWDRVGGLTYILTQFKYSRRGDLQGLVFNTAVAVRRWKSISALRALKQGKVTKLINFRVRYKHGYKAAEFTGSWDYDQGYTVLET